MYTRQLQFLHQIVMRPDNESVEALTNEEKILDEFVIVDRCSVSQVMKTIALGCNVLQAAKELWR